MRNDEVREGKAERARRGKEKVHSVLEEREDEEGAHVVITEDEDRT